MVFEDADFKFGVIVAKTETEFRVRKLYISRFTPFRIVLQRSQFWHQHPQKLLKYHLQKTAKTVACSYVD